MKHALLRFILVTAIILLAYETLLRLAVTRTESWEEVQILLLMAATVGGLVWSSWPAFEKSGRARGILRAGHFVGFAISIHAICYFYSWHVRPNIGFYEEPEWVAKHPEFQKRQREKIERNLW